MLHACHNSSLATDANSSHATDDSAHFDRQRLRAWPWQLCTSPLRSSITSHHKGIAETLRDSPLRSSLAKDRIVVLHHPGVCGDGDLPKPSFMSAVMVICGDGAATA